MRTNAILKTAAQPPKLLLEGGAFLGAVAPKKAPPSKYHFAANGGGKMQMIVRNLN